MHVNLTYCGGHFTTYTNVELLCCTPKTHMFYEFYVLCQLYLSEKQFMKNKSTTVVVVCHSSSVALAICIFKFGSLCLIVI